MKKQLIIISILLVLSGSLLLAQDKLHVVTPHETIASLAAAIGGDAVSAVSLSSGNRDPHFIVAKPSFMTKTRKADLWVRFGMDLEIGYERLILEGARNPNILVGNSGHLDLSRNIVKLEVPTTAVDRSMGDVHPQGNPHYWLDPYNCRVMVVDLADRMIELSPSNAQLIGENLKAFINQLDEAMFGEAAVAALGGEKLWELQLSGQLKAALAEANIAAGGWYGKMLPYKGTNIVTYHKTLNYFANRFGLVVAIELEPKPGIPPGPRHVLKVIQTIQNEDVKLIAQAGYYDQSSAQNASSKTGVKFVVFPTGVGGADGATDYISMIDTIITTLSSNLK
jgi:zinc/manganese transport system substrate-binding protein